MLVDTTYHSQCYEAGVCVCWMSGAWCTPSLHVPVDIALGPLGPEYWPDVLTAPPVVGRGLPREGLEGDRVTTPHTLGRREEGGGEEGIRRRGEGGGGMPQSTNPYTISYVPNSVRMEMVATSRLRV